MASKSPRWVLGHRVTPIDTIGDYATLRCETGPGVPGPPPHYHDVASELFLVLSGVLEVRNGNDWVRVEAGQSICLPPRVVHTFRNPGAAVADWLMAFSPRGFERFFEDFGVPGERAGSREESVSDRMLARVARECARYGMILEA